MTEEMKLLRALCEALGFEVETILDRGERKESEASAMRYNKGMGYKTDRLLRTKTGAVGAMMLDIDEDGMYTSYLVEPIISYRLTKKG